MDNSVTVDVIKFLWNSGVDLCVKKPLDIRHFSRLPRKHRRDQISREEGSLNIDTNAVCTKCRSCFTILSRAESLFQNHATSGKQNKIKIISRCVLLSIRSLKN